MPHYLVPRKSGVHRAACFALYRALLRASRPHLPPQFVPQDSQSHPRSQQRYGLHSPNRLRITAAFHRNSQLQAPHAIITQLQRGYDLLAALRAGTVPEDDASIGPKTYKRRTLSSYIPSKRKATIEKSPSQKKTSIFSRPLPQSQLSGTGIRKVPFLVNGNGIPFLRIKKPQPVALSMRIERMILWREKRWDNIKFLEQHLITAAWGEDNWERMLVNEFGSREELAGADLVENVINKDEQGKRRQGGTRGGRPAKGDQGQRARKQSRYRMVKFADAVDEALREEKQKLDAWQRKRRNYAKKLMEIVKRERELKTEELKQSRALAKARRVERRRFRREAAEIENLKKASGSG